MTDLGVVHWIRGLDENGAVGLARALILAEAGLHGLPLDEFSMSGRVKAGDGGIDGTTQFPEFLGERIPTGSCVWQVKSGATRPSAAKELDTARHAPLADAIRQGADYVLFWTGDQVSPVSDAVRDEFRNAVQEIRAGAEIHFLFAEGIERLCLAHLGVLAQASPFPLSGLVSLVRWGFPSKFRDVAFQADARRSQAVDVIRAHVSTFDVEPYELHIFGDTGVGKSRLVYEALAIPGLQERVLVAPDATQFERSILTHVASSDDRRLVLVVDDCDSENRASLSKYTGMAEGRIRLVTIGPRWTREQPSMDARRIEVLPLEAGASKQIAQSVGLGDRDADLVAAYTEGYPGLAFTLAKAIYHGVGPESLVARVRGHEEVGSVLASLVPPDDVPTLGLLALFEKLGFDGDLAQELTVVCRTLDVDEPSVRRVADRELGRFVSTAGRFRRVSPRLFAVWLATKLLSTNKSTLTTALAGLPGSLRDRIVSQIQDFAGDAVVDEVLAELLAQPPFADGALADVDEGAGRLLHVAAIASPNSAMDAIERLLSGTTDEDVRLFGAGRRETVWALEVLLWFEEHFQRAADALLRLALGENEQWANNATGVLQGAFRVFL